MPTKKTFLTIGVAIVVLGAIIGLLGLSYVLYWGPMPDSSNPQLFPYYSFWGGLALLIIGVVATLVAEYGVKE